MLFGIAAGALIPKVELASSIDFLPAVGAGTAASLLSAFAGGFITVIGLIVSIVIAGLTFGSASISPRLVKEWQEDQTSRVMVGILIFSVVYAFVVLGQIAPQDKAEYAPAFAVWLIVPLILCDVLALLQVTRRLGHVVRFVETMDSACRQGVAAAAELFPYGIDAGAQVTAHEPSTEPSMVVASPQTGVVSDIDAAALSQLASQLDAIFLLVPTMGAYVEQGAPLLRVWSASPADETAILRSVLLSDERTIARDPLYALRLIVDIASRALSPGINDPTTAVQALDRITHFLSTIAFRRLDYSGTIDPALRSRLILRTATWVEAVELAFTEIRQFGGTSSQVMRKMRACLLELKANVPAERRQVVDEQLELLDACVDQNFADPRERDIARSADVLGFGGTA